MLRLLAYSVFTFLFNTTAFTQKVLGKVGEDDVKNIKVLKEQMRFLLHSETPIEPEPNATKYPASWAIYDSVVARSYDLDSRHKFGKELDSSFGNMAFQKVLMYNADLILDIVPLDSIGIQVIGEEEAITDKRFEGFKFYSVGYIVGEHFAIQHTIAFTSNHRIFGVYPFIDFNKENEGVDIEGFLYRHNYHLIKRTGDRLE